MNYSKKACTRLQDGKGDVAMKKSFPRMQMVSKCRRDFGPRVRRRTAQHSLVLISASATVSMRNVGGLAVKSTLGRTLRKLATRERITQPRKAPVIEHQRYKEEQ